jgi:hypothetical protein
MMGRPETLNQWARTPLAAQRRAEREGARVRLSDTFALLVAALLAAHIQLRLGSDEPLNGALAQAPLPWMALVS